MNNDKEVVNMKQEMVTTSYLSSWLINNISGLDCDETQANIIISTCETNGYIIIKIHDKLYLMKNGKFDQYDNEIYPEELLIFVNECICEQIEICKELLHNIDFYDIATYSAEFMKYLKLYKNYKILNDMLKATNYYQDFLKCLNFVLDKKIGKRKRKVQKQVNMGD